MNVIRILRPALRVFSLLLMAYPSTGVSTDFNMRSLKELREAGVIRQQWDNSCAAAALATVFTYFLNDPVTERQAAAKMLEKTHPLKVRARGGFSFLDMKSFAEIRGHTARAYINLEIEDLRIFQGAIVPIQSMGYYHFVVFISSERGQVKLADPAFGNRSMSESEFLKVWQQGLALHLSKNTEHDRAP